jgi:hypothetical protein
MPKKNKKAATKWLLFFVRAPFAGALSLLNTKAIGAGKEGLS